ncbi:flocculation FLO11-like isoform X5 [Pelobates cultripes]|uniref:Flocculation FLO11-like isoform X5 n=1 Tax=Pelobates cultripes TaxID=61616 RepID=A0AAD1RSN7_PELCU|nr:flocculation FLO11-like isoform X5 [Pelobates cultripes]
MFMVHGVFFCTVLFLHTAFHKIRPLDVDFLAKYCIFSQEKLAEYKRAFEAVDSDEDGYLDCMQVLMALKEIVPPHSLTDAEELYVYRILEIVDYYVTDGLTDLRLFAVMASLAQKIAALE